MAALSVRFIVMRGYRNVIAKQFSEASCQQEAYVEGTSGVQEVKRARGVSMMRSRQACFRSTLLRLDNDKAITAHQNTVVSSAL